MNGHNTLRATSGKGSLKKKEEEGRKEEIKSYFETYLTFIKEAKETGDYSHEWANNKAKSMMVQMLNHMANYAKNAELDEKCLLQVQGTVDIISKWTNGPSQSELKQLIMGTHEVACACIKGEITIEEALEQAGEIGAQNNVGGKSLNKNMRAIMEADL